MKLAPSLLLVVGATAACSAGRNEAAGDSGSGSDGRTSSLDGGHFGETGPSDASSQSDAVHAQDAGDADLSKDGGPCALVEGGAISPPAACSSTAPNVTCVGDGVTDDTACLAHALSGSGSEIVLPGGKTYLVSGALGVTSGKSLVGNGSTILSDGAAPILSLGGTSTTVCGVFVVQMGTAADAPLVGVSAGATGIAFTNGGVAGTGPIGLYIEPGGPTGPVLVQGNVFKGTHYPILLNAGNQGTSLTNYQHDITIDRNSFTGAGVDAIEINSPVFNLAEGSQVPGIAVYNVAITNNSMSQQGEFGIGFAGGTNSILCGNVIDNTGSPPGSANIQGIHIEDRAANVKVIGNRISHTDGTATFHSAIEVLQSNHIYLFDNVIEDTTAGSGIELGWDPKGGHNDHCFVSGNHVAGSGVYGIDVGGLHDAGVDTLIGPSGGFGGNVTVDSGMPGNQKGQGSIYATPGNGITVTGNSGS
jgi:Right handed beta helix region